MKGNSVLNIFSGTCSTSLPFSTCTFVNLATRTNLGTPPLTGSDIGFSESLMSYYLKREGQLKYVFKGLPGFHNEHLKIAGNVENASKFYNKYHY